MDEDDMQQFSLRWHNHQCSVIGALGHMLNTGALADVVLNASGTSVKAHRLVLASCSQYFSQLFKEVEAENSTLVIVLSCDASELKLLLTFMYTGEVTTSKRRLPALLKLAQTLKVSGLTDADTNSTLTPTDNETTIENCNTNSPINLELHKTNVVDDSSNSIVTNDDTNSDSKLFDDLSPSFETKEPNYISGDYLTRNEKDRLSKLDQIVQNLYSTHKIGNPTLTSAVTPPILPISGEPTENYDRRWRLNSSVCNICNKRLSNQYNLRVHMETHAGRKHACRACSHVSRSRDALRKHVAYRHAAMRDARGQL